MEANVRLKNKGNFNIIVKKLKNIMLNEILLFIYNSEKINESIKKICQNKVKEDDIKSHLLIQIIDMDKEKVEEAYRNNYLEFLCIRIIMNQYISNHSSYSKLYGKNKKVEYIDNLTFLNETQIDMKEHNENQINKNMDDKFLRLTDRDKVEYINRILLHIKPANAFLFRLYYFDGLSHSQIGRLIGINRQAVRYSIVNTIKYIKNSYENDDIY